MIAPSTGHKENTLTDRRKLSKPKIRNRLATGGARRAHGEAGAIGGRWFSFPGLKALASFRLKPVLRRGGP